MRTQSKKKADCLITESLSTLNRTVFAIYILIVDKNTERSSVALLLLYVACDSRILSENLVLMTYSFTEIKTFISVWTDRKSVV